MIYPILVHDLPIEDRTPVDYNTQLINDMIKAGITPPQTINYDGTLYRFSSDGKRGDLNGWYVAFNTGLQNAVFGCWKQGVTVSWRADIGRKLSFTEEMELKKRITEAKSARDRERGEKASAAAETASSIINSASAADDSHPYLVKKGIQAHGALVAGDGRLVIPICSDGHDDITSIQYIDGDSRKQFLAGGAVAGGWWHIGEMKNAPIVFICEGFATAASIHEETRQTVVIAFAANNLHKVALAVRELVGVRCRITICADRDDSGVGELKSGQAASAIGARVVVSPTPSDFNDAVQSGVDIKELLMPVVASTGWLINADVLCAQDITVRWLIKHWIPRNSLIMLHGASGSGKSLVVLDMVARIASDSMGDWEGHKVRHGNVIYLAGEGHTGMVARMRAWQEHNNINSLGNIWVSSSGCDLNSSGGLQLARESILAVCESPDLIVVDTLHRFMSGDENSAQDAGEMIRACAELQSEFNCSVLLVHHTGVSEAAQGRARGSSAWKGAMESEISIVAGDKDNPLEIVNVKSKDAMLSETQYMRIRGHKFDGSSGGRAWLDEDNEYVIGAVVVSSEAVIKVDKKGEDDKNAFNDLLNLYGVMGKNGQKILTEKSWSDNTHDESGVKTGAIREKRRKFKKRLLDAGYILTSEEGYYANFGVINL
jgi:phage/plasmid primase-like uncharacterized protein